LLPLYLRPIHRNLDASVPLSVEDAYPVKFREPNFHGVLFSDTRHRPRLAGERGSQIVEGV
jgi:hypothetical protein